MVDVVELEWDKAGCDWIGDPVVAAVPFADSPSAVMGFACTLRLEM